MTSLLHYEIVNVAIDMPEVQGERCQMGRGRPRQVTLCNKSKDGGKRSLKVQLPKGYTVFKFVFFFFITCTNLC